MNTETVAQLRALRQRAYDEAMALDIDGSLGKDSGATQFGTLVNSYVKLLDKESEYSVQEQSNVVQFPQANFLPSY